MKRFFAFIVLMSITFSTFAYTNLEKESATYMANKGYIVSNGTNIAAYRLGDSITRKEVMKIVAKLDGSTIPEKCEGKFSDVKNDWGCKYIEWALSKDYIAANAKFRPDDEITIPETLKLILKARNIEKTYNESAWQANYIKTAYDEDLIDQIYGASNYTKVATRGLIFSVASRTYNDFVVPAEDDFGLDDAELEAELKNIFDLIDGANIQ